MWLENKHFVKTFSWGGKIGQMFVGGSVKSKLITLFVQPNTNRFITRVFTEILIHPEDLNLNTFNFSTILSQASIYHSLKLKILDIYHFTNNKTKTLYCERTL